MNKGANLLYRNVPWIRGGLVFKSHRLLYHSTLGLRVIKKKKKKSQWLQGPTAVRSRPAARPILVPACPKVCTGLFLNSPPRSKGPSWGRASARRAPHIRRRGGLVFKAHGLLYHSTLGLRVIKKKKKRRTLHLPTLGSGISIAMIDSWTTNSWDLSGKGTKRAENVQGTPTQSHLSSSILVYEDHVIKVPSLIAAGAYRGISLIRKRHPP